MKKIFLLLFIIGLVVVACLKPPRDNEYDPNNPDKARLVGVVAGPEGNIRNALVTLLIDEEVYDTTLTDAEGAYEITDIDPGIYTITFKANYFTPGEFSPESLPAGALDTVDFYLSEHLFTFDNESPGTAEPFDFSVVVGDWSVIEDNSQPGEHTVPNVYNCTDYMGLTLYNPWLADHNIAANFKIVGPDTSFWQAGFVLRMQDSMNYYLVSMTPLMVHLFKFESSDTTLLDYSACNINSDSWHYLFAEVCGQTFSVYLDYELKIEVTDSTFSEGQAGLWCSKEIQPINVNFDDVTICR